METQRHIAQGRQQQIERGAQSQAPAPSWWQNLWLPGVSMAALCVALAFTPAQDASPGVDFPIETLAHHLGHELNSLWVAASLLLLIIPSLLLTWKARRAGLRARAVWAWRAVDIALLDFLAVDALGKRFLLSLVRPGTPDRAGFPSGHATCAFALAWLISKRFPKLGALWFAIATLIAWSRVEVLAHFPYQVLGGALLGMALGHLAVTRRGGVLLPRAITRDADLREILDEPSSAQQR
jgi:membrane-associated phospholipid phosphatase